jgi:hypothetical protein
MNSQAKQVVKYYVLGLATGLVLGVAITLLAVKP